MDSRDIVDDVNALLKMGVGDSYRLEHIKQAYIQNQTVWITDKNYLLQMKEKYLTKHRPDEQPADGASGDVGEVGEMIHCWKCGKRGPLGANFCMACGASVFDVGAKPDRPKEPAPASRAKRRMGLKIPVLVGIPVLVLVALGSGYALGYFDSALERLLPDKPKADIADTKAADKLPKPSTGKADSKCGSGTVFDPKTNSCVLENSKCGSGTVFDPKTNSCILDK